MQPAPSNSVEIRSNRENQSRAYIAATRVRVLDIYVMAELQGLTPDEIVDALPHLTLAQVHAALSYYFGNRDEVVRQLREEEDLARRFRALTGPGPLEATLQCAELAIIPYGCDIHPD
jgi:uncharacterized protein (DUF433 family)